MSTVKSADGTTIAYSKTGSGPALILIDGALCYRSFGPAKKFAQELSDHYTVYTYDRRGRGESGGGDTPYAVEREVEDLAALAEATGGSPYVLGLSSGAALALEAANNGVQFAKIAVYEAPFAITPGSRTEPADYYPNLTKAIDEKRNGDAVKLFMNLVGAPKLMVAMFPVMPGWSKLKAVARTLANDRAIMHGSMDGTALADDRFADVTAPTLSMAGGKSDEWFRAGMRQVADRVKDGSYRTIDGQNHMLKPSAVAPALREFFQ